MCQGIDEEFDGDVRGASARGVGNDTIGQVMHFVW
eukprot:COSAG01_NODE_9606_length_2393_cov_1.788579_7_plen_35_part_00